LILARDFDGEASMTVPEILGYAALILLIASFFMKTIIWLRLLAIASNAAIVIYGIVAPHYPILVLGLAMLAVNAWRLMEMRRLVGAVSAATAGQGAPITVDWVLPFMRPVDIPKGHVLFRKGEVADAMYFISSGKVRIDELNVEIGKGSLFGEIGIFSVDRLRTATATCIEPCSLLLVSADKVRELYYQNPEFGFFLVGVITRRLTEDLERAKRA
jgi:CRP/FNR family cyclic AMP-dependent transcriptional regulator